MTPAEKIAKLRALPQEALGIGLSNDECSWLLDAAEALTRLMGHLDVEAETMTVSLGPERVAYWPEDASVIDGAVAALVDDGHCSRCAARHPWRDMSPATHECADCMAADALRVEGGQP